jgi:hypothetical protein
MADRPRQRRPDRQPVSLEPGARINARFEGRGYSETWQVFALAGDSRSTGPLILDADPTTPGLQVAPVQHESGRRFTTPRL